MNFNSNMSFDERERFAYSSGNVGLSAQLLNAAELEDQVNTFDDQIDTIEKEAYKRGYGEGFGTDHIEVLEDMEKERDRANEKTEKAKVLVRSLLDLFHRDEMKTVAGRKKIHQHLQSQLISLNY